MARQGIYWCAVLALCCGCSTPARRYLADRAAPPAEVAAVDSSETDEPDETESLETETTSPIRTVSSDDSIPYESGPVQLAATAELSLPVCIATGLAQNPDLIAARQADNVSSAALGVAQTYPFNPFVQVQATPIQDTRFPNSPNTTYHYVLLMQTIQLAHQQQFREEGAVATLNSTRWNIHQAELLNVAQTERLYFTAVYLHGLLELAEASHTNNQQMLKTLEKQLEAGQATAADVALVRVDTRSTAHQRRLARANYETALRDLKRQLGLNVDDPAMIQGDLRNLIWRAPADVSLEPRSDDSSLQIPADREKVLICSHAASRPDVMAARSDIDVARANLSLATASKTPDLQIGPYYQRTLDGTTFWGFRAQMDLPVINSGRPLERQRAAELGQRLTAWQQSVRRAELEAQAAWERYKLASEAVAEDAEFGNVDLPAEFDQLEKQFIAGEVDVIRVMQARTSMIQNRRVQLDLLNELAQSAANVTASTGISVEQLLR